MKFVSRYLWVICSLAALFTLAGTLKASLPQSLIGAWTSWSTLSQARANAATVRLPDGRILIEGGDTSSGPLQSAEIFATDGTLSSATSMNSPRSHHFAVVLSDGRVLVGGGMTTGGGITNSAEIYDPATDSWSSVPAMITARGTAPLAFGMSSVPAILPVGVSSIRSSPSCSGPCAPRLAFIVIDAH